MLDVYQYMRIRSRSLSLHWVANEFDELRVNNVNANDNARIKEYLNGTLQMTSGASSKFVKNLCDWSLEDYWACGSEELPKLIECEWCGLEIHLRGHGMIYYPFCSVTCRDVCRTEGEDDREA